MQYGHKTVPFPSRWSQGRISVTLVLIAVNVAAFLTQWGLDQMVPGSAETYLALSREGIFQHGFYWQFITYMLLHGGWFHLGANCLGLFFFGREVETLCGPKHMLGMYFLGGVLGGVVQLLAIQESVPVMGASAGVYALVLAFTTILPELEITLLLFFIIPLRMRAKWLGRALIGTSVFFAITGLYGDIGHVAHLGGALTGWLYARRLGFGGQFWMVRMIRDRRRIRERRERMEPEQFISEEIDPILDKISREGIHSLNREERRVLELGRDKIARRTTPSR